MADTGEVTVTVRADARPAVESLENARDLLDIRCSTDRYRREAAYARLFTRALKTAAEAVTCRRMSRRLLDPRRGLDRWHARYLWRAHRRQKVIAHELEIEARQV